MDRTWTTLLLRLFRDDLVRCLRLNAIRVCSAILLGRTSAVAARLRAKLQHLTMPESNIKLYLLNRKRRVSFTPYHAINARDDCILDSALTEGLKSDASICGGRETL